MGAVIGPSSEQYRKLQGTSTASPKEIVETSLQGSDGAADIYLLPSIKPGFKSSGAFWAMNMGRVDASDLFLIDSSVNTQYVAQFADCVWYDPSYTGSPLIDTRPQHINTFGQDAKAFEMGYYLNKLEDSFAAPKPEQFKTIDFAKLNLDTATKLSTADFLKQYSKLIGTISNKSKSTQSKTKPASTGASKPSSSKPQATAATRSGDWVYRSDLLQVPAGGKAKPADPYVSITELRQHDPVTGQINSQAPRTWAVVFAADNKIGAKLSGVYRGSKYTYINESINLYRDSNQNNLFDAGDAAIGVVVRKSGATDILNANYFDAASIGSGTWLISSTNQLTLFNQNRSQSFGPTAVPSGLSF